MNTQSEEDPQQYVHNLLLNPVTISITRDGKVLEWGSGFLVGKDRVLTAAHVVDAVRNGDVIVVDHHGMRSTGRTIAIGARATNDAAIVALDTPRLVRIAQPPRLCATATEVGARLVVMSANGATYTFSAPMKGYGSEGNNGVSATTTWFGPGASGSAVIDLGRHCLAGVVSQSARTVGSTTVDEKTIEVVDQSTLLADGPSVLTVVEKLPVEDATRAVLGR
ncbi:serine protease [Burkholderia cepacia]|uniref:S1 family peptidase n=1 Tax=Burkholderia cepacia TaxID=292 RepID=UPI001CF1DB76|nr:serine protease [Burkholderia cepacia]MCA8212608.1 serine protease [Burkholderia cepacia]